jgi:hypothetical protein
LTIGDPDERRVRRLYIAQLMLRFRFAQTSSPMQARALRRGNKTG